MSAALVKSKNGDEQALRMFEQSIQPQRRRHAAFDVLAQPHWIDREQAAFDSVEEKRNNPATKDDKGDHHASALAVARRFSGVTGAGCFSSKISSIRLRPARRTVMASRGISSCVPEGRQITEPIENKAADRVDAVGINLETEMFAQIVETRIAADQKFSVLERLDVKIDISARAPRRSEFPRRCPTA